MNVRFRHSNGEIKTVEFVNIPTDIKYLLDMCESITGIGENKEFFIPDLKNATLLHIKNPETGDFYWPVPGMKINKSPCPPPVFKSGSTGPTLSTPVYRPKPVGIPQTELPQKTEKTVTVDNLKVSLSDVAIQLAKLELLEQKFRNSTVSEPSPASQNLTVANQKQKIYKVRVISNTDGNNRIESLNIPNTSFIKVRDYFFDQINNEHYEDLIDICLNDRIVWSNKPLKQQLIAEGKLIK